MTVSYKARNGKTQLKPAFSDLVRMDADMQGFCVACGEEQDGVEPDARKYECEACGEHKVYGAAELILMGLCHD